MEGGGLSTTELAHSSLSMQPAVISGADPGFLKRGSVIGLQAKKGGPGGGLILGPMLKSLQRGPNRGGRTPWTPPPDPPMYLHTSPMQNEATQFKEVSHSNESATLNRMQFV